MATEWDEIRKLAADLQRAQLSGSVQKLSERNCIEIVNKLVESGLLNIIFTSDGKEYITPNHLQREISDLLYASGGRIELAEIAQSLVIDYSHVETQSELISKSDRDTHLVLGQLISTEYLDRIAHEINEKLQLFGITTTSEFTKDYNLPADFLFEELVTKRLGSIIEGFQDENDPKVIITSAYLSRNRARIRGALAGVTLPTSLANISNRFGFDGRLFMNLTEQLLREGKLKGTISGGKQLSKAIYIPDAFAKAQARYIDDFLAQNEYLDYDSLKRLGISDPQGTIKRRCKEDDLIFLSTCCVTQSLVNQVMSAIDVAVAGADAWVDAMPLLPSVMSNKDCELLLQQLLTTQQKKGQWSNAKLMCDTIVISKNLAAKVREPFGDKIRNKASMVIKDGTYAAAVKQNSLLTDKKGSLLSTNEQPDKKEERRKRATGGKGGGGTQGRETKTKSTKKKAGNKRRGVVESDSDDKDSDDEFSFDSSEKKKPVALKFMSISELSDSLKQISVLQDAPSELFDALAMELYPDLTREYQDLVVSLYQSAITSSMQGKKKTLSEFQDKVMAIVEAVRLYEKGLSVFEGNDRISLEKYLLKTLCSEIMSELIKYVAEDQDLEVDKSKEMTADQRVKFFSQIPSDAAEPLVAIHKALGDSSVTKFLSSLEINLANVGGFAIMKQDKKKDRQTLFNHRHSLLEQLDRSNDPAVVLHLASLIIFQSQTGHMVHANGKLVPTIISNIAPQLTEEQRNVLSTYQTSVIKHMSASGGDDKDELQRFLEQNLPNVKAIAVACDSKRAK